eukprot:scaffold8558_cov121-Isochrysis_galbana.AAC.1
MPAVAVASLRRAAPRSSESRAPRWERMATIQEYFTQAKNIIRRRRSSSAPILRARGGAVYPPLPPTPHPKSQHNTHTALFALGPRPVLSYKRYYPRNHITIQRS